MKTRVSSWLGVGIVHFASAMLWLWGSNATILIAPSREMIKSTAFALAAGASIASTLSILRLHTVTWARQIASEVLASSSVAFTLTVAVSRIIYPDFLFHEAWSVEVAIRLVMLFGLAVGAVLSLAFITALVVRKL